MQSYAQIADPSLSISDLENLGSRLELPKGWSYRTRVLTEDSRLRANGVAYVINDNLYDSYQKVTEQTAVGSSGEGLPLDTANAR